MQIKISKWWPSITVPDSLIGHHANDGQPEWLTYVIYFADIILLHLLAL